MELFTNSLLGGQDWVFTKNHLNVVSDNVTTWSEKASVDVGPSLYPRLKREARGEGKYRFVSNLVLVRNCFLLLF